MGILTNKFIYKSKTYTFKNKYVTLVSLGTRDQVFKFIGTLPDYFHDNNEVNILYKNVNKNGKIYLKIYQIYNVTEKKLYIPSINKTYLTVYENGEIIFNWKHHLNRQLYFIKIK